MDMSAPRTPAGADEWQRSTAKCGLAKNTCFQTKYNARYIQLMNTYVISPTEQLDLVTVFGAPYEDLRKLGMSHLMLVFSLCTDWVTQKHISHAGGFAMRKMFYIEEYISQYVRRPNPSCSMMSQDFVCLCEESTDAAGCNKLWGTARHIAYTYNIPKESYIQFLAKYLFSPAEISELQTNPDLHILIYRHTHLDPQDTHGLAEVNKYLLASSFGCTAQRWKQDKAAFIRPYAKAQAAPGNSTVDSKKLYYNTMVEYMQTVVTECDRQVEIMLQADPPHLA